MTRMAKANEIVGLDLGTTKIAAIIAEAGDDGEIKIIGVGTSPSEGLRRGVVVNLDKTVNSIVKAVQEAELMAGIEVESVFAGIAGDHIRSINSRGVIAVTRKGNEITEADIARVVDQAQAVSIPMDREIIHVIPQEFIVDEQTGIKDPVGMAGVRLEAEVHIVTGAVTSAQNIYKSIERAGLRVRDLVLQPLAASYAVLDPEEKELGVALLDVGGGTTDIALFFEGSIQHTAVIALGGNNATNDIAIGLRTPTTQAEMLKKRYGCALSSLVDGRETIRVPGVGGREEREVSRQVLSAIIEPRMEEIFSLAQRELKKTEYADLLAAGIVLTGGSARMDGMAQLAEQVFDLPVKIGVPQGVGGLTDSIRDPIHATGVGLVLFGHENRHGDGFSGVSEANLFDNIVQGMRRWWGDFF
ncbi:cell division protein FtsA [candidate division TA06 bacterium DG_24]|uniref:Cell division protein FtsA n=4 Tax=Bacteria division TA06 TaxID=1156500 RepID=A0A0S8G8A9_UNCT6|nr:MAG: cell division protein FtsA [candidate division TA06 bacterium DG_24]KPK68833.1 MAG: cell division protein FtsA [candidate division TA06 bacterium SM23_40]